MLSRRVTFIALLIIGIAAMTASMKATGGEDNGAPTFYKDALPILQKNCQTCHRPGEIAPMSFMSYKDVRPWAKAIKTAVVNRQMPPWFADPNYGHFTNDKTLSDAAIKTLAAWVDGGAVEGDAKDAPPPAQFVDGWGFKPDMIIEMPKDVPLQATGTINYKNILVKVNFPEDRWVVAADLRPGNNQAVHHMRANVLPPGSEFMKNAEPGIAYEQGDPKMGRQDEGIDLLGKFNPGLGSQDFSEYQSAKFVPKGSDIVFNMHYTATGKETTDRSRLALKFGRAPKYRYYVNEGPTASNLAIPAGDSNAEVVSEMTANYDTQLVYMQPHMHLRGKDYEVRLIFPDGRMETIMRTKWDFNWQIGFDMTKPIAIPKGTRLIGIAHFDNSANNKWNPDRAKFIVWGPQNWDEMQNCFMGYLIDPNFKDVKNLFKRSGPSMLPRGTSGPALSTLLIPGK
ncbi:MAG TPA: cytochrome c [Terriglobia bacterium]|nr:cytochrome c [Terriglobia bacterium]